MLAANGTPELLAGGKTMENHRIIEGGARYYPAVRRDRAAVSRHYCSAYSVCPFPEEAMAYTSNAAAQMPTSIQSQTVSKTHSSAMNANRAAHKANAIVD